MSRGRRRVELGFDLESEIRARTLRGESAVTIWNVLGRPCSLSTIARRQSELRTGTKPEPPSAGSQARRDDSPAVAPEVPDTVPENTSIEDLNRWIKRLETAAASAETQGNLSALSSIAAKVAQLMSLRHKATPLPKQNPNERPDYIELARKGEERLLTLIKGTFREQASVTSP